MVKPDQQGGGLAARANQDVLRRVNREVSLRAMQLSNSLLTSLFRAMFHVEKSQEMAEPEVFTFDHEPDRILWPRVDPGQLMHLARSIVMEEIRAVRYQSFTEYDFVVLADVSHSMMVRWWSAYGGRSKNRDGGGLLANSGRYRTTGDRTKLFLLKYAVSAFLHAAKANHFKSRVVLFGNGPLKTFDSSSFPDLEQLILYYMDDEFAGIAAADGSAPFYNQVDQALVLKEELGRHRRAIILYLSDFMDHLERLNDKPGDAVPIENVVVPLAELASRQRLLVLRLNDECELSPSERHQEGEADLLTLEHPTMNGERPVPPDDQEMKKKKKDIDMYCRRAALWDAHVRESLTRFGIRFEHLVTGRDDAVVDKKIQRLGLTGYGR